MRESAFPFHFRVKNYTNMTSAETVPPAQNQMVEHYPDSNSAKIQKAIASLSAMESSLDELNSQVNEMKRRLVVFAEAQSEQAKAEIIDRANKEAATVLDAVRESAQKEADEIISRGSEQVEALRKSIGSKLPQAVSMIVDAVQG